MAGGKRPNQESGGGGEAKVWRYVELEKSIVSFQKNKACTDWGATEWNCVGDFKIASWNVAGTYPSC